MGHGHDLRARPEQPLVGLQDHLAAVVDRRHADHGARALGHHLPGHDVGVMLEFGQHDLVAALQRRGEDVGHQVYALGAAADEDDLVRRVGPQEVGHRAPGLLVGVAGPGREGVGGTVDVGVVVRVEVGQGVDHRLWLLRGGRVVEPDERLAVDPLLEDGEVAAHGVGIEESRRGEAGVGGGRLPAHAERRARGGAVEHGGQLPVLDTANPTHEGPQAGKVRLRRCRGRHDRSRHLGHRHGRQRRHARQLGRCAGQRGRHRRRADGHHRRSHAGKAAGAGVGNGRHGLLHEPLGDPRHHVRRRIVKRRGCRRGQGRRHGGEGIHGRHARGEDSSAAAHLGVDWRCS